MGKKMDINQYNLAKEIAKTIESCGCCGFAEPYDEFIPSKDGSQIDVFMDDTCDGDPAFYASLVTSSELEKGLYEFEDSTYISRINELFDRFCRDFNFWKTAINKYGKKYHMKYDESIKDDRYMFSVYGDVPDNYSIFDDGFKMMNFD